MVKHLFPKQTEKNYKDKVEKALNHCMSLGLTSIHEALLLPGLELVIELTGQDKLLDEIYAEYLRKLEECLVKAGSPAPRAEALALMSLLEGSTLFVGHGRRWADDADAVRDATLALIDARYGKEE